MHGSDFIKVNMALEGIPFPKTLDVLIDLGRLFENDGMKKTFIINEGEIVEPFNNSGTLIAGSNANFVWRDVLTSYIPREEVYDCINDYFLKYRVNEIIKDVNLRFPKEKFEDTFPHCATLELIYNGLFLL